MRKHRDQLVASALAVTLAFANVVATASHGEDPAVFDSVKMQVEVDGDTRAIRTILSLEKDRLTLRSRKTGAELKQLRYAELSSVDYAYSKHTRWKAGIATAVVANVLAIPVFIFKGKKHWLTVRTEQDFAILRLDKRDFRLIIAELEARSGKDVDLIGQRDY